MLQVQYISTTVEIILYYLTNQLMSHTILIYNSRNYSILLNKLHAHIARGIYNSRNYSILLNKNRDGVRFTISTTVEIILYYLTRYVPVIMIYLQQ